MNEHSEIKAQEVCFPPHQKSECVLYCPPYPRRWPSCEN